MKTLAIALVAVVALAGCAAPSQGKASRSTAADVEALLASHLEVVCAVEIDGVRGVTVTVSDCVWASEAGAVKDTVVTCTGLTDNTDSLFAANRESTLSVGYYTPGAAADHIEALRFDIENGDSATGECTIEGITDKFGIYEVHFEPRCFKDAAMFLPGVQLQPKPCDYRDSHAVTREWLA